MSATTSQESSSGLKVLFDFRYKTAEGREVTIKKNERLYLLEKTNADWWRVARNTEQRSFYVPATYVRESSKSPRKRSEEERETILEPPRDPSYASMPKESSNAMRNVKKWLAGAIDARAEAKTDSFRESESNEKLENEGVSGNRSKHPLLETAVTKSLERDRRSTHLSDRDDDGTNGSRGSRESGEYEEHPRKSASRYGTSPKGVAAVPLVMDAALHDPFRRELESSLDRRNMASKAGARLRTRSSNSDASVPEEEGGRRTEAGEKGDRERDRRSGHLSVHEESDGGGGSGDEKILKDKRRTWAVEELMSELTQMCKERGKVVEKKAAPFQLKSTEVKGNFDPIEKLTREIHEMNRKRSEGPRPRSPINVCKIAVNSGKDSSVPAEEIGGERWRRSIADGEDSRALPALSSSPKVLKSPKILDEYNEANILNDWNALGEGTRSRSEERSLSDDKPPSYRNRRGTPTSPALEPKLAEVHYSNVKANADRSHKVRPKLKLTIMEPTAELRLTPSLEKLANEIQFLPAKRSSELGFTASNEDLSRGSASKSDESLDRTESPLRAISPRKHKLQYKGSLKATKPREDDAKKSLLPKSLTMRCATIPECYRRFRTGNDRPDEALSFKRRSRSLSDLDTFEGKYEEEEEEEDESIEEASKPRNIKPVPLPRTKIRALNAFQEASGRDRQAENATDPGFRSSKSWEETEVRRRNVDIESSTAVGFKTLLCASDSGSDNCLQSKELLSSSGENLIADDRPSPRKWRASLPPERATRVTRESLSDDQMLSSNASSEALHSESEPTATLDLSGHPSPVDADDAFECAIELPPGWKQKYDPDLRQICFLNERGDKWFSSNDAEGKIYFFEENSNESSWVLPSIDSEKWSIANDERTEKSDGGRSRTTEKRTERAPSVLVDREPMGKKGAPPGADWPHLCDGNNMLVLKEGLINRTKITENGKKLRKNWNTSYAVLTELFLLFFKDAKTFAMMKTGQSSIAKPDISVDLNGALVEPGERASSRKNVYTISTVLGLQVLVQSDNSAVASEWFDEIDRAIRKLPSGKAASPIAAPIESRRLAAGYHPGAMELVAEDAKKMSKIGRSRSMKMKRLDDSLEDLSGSPAERQTRIKAKLRRFFLRRPAVETLVKNGIYKDEPAFGAYLGDVCPVESPRVPLFVKACIEVLESNEENMKTDGLYRASGNLSQIQKIRLQVDQYKLEVLSQEEDVHVLAGALKLFFRELKEPLIPSSFFKEAVNASMLKKSSAKIQCFRDIVRALPSPNYDTLLFLLKHLLRVTSYQEYNRMHIPNLAIVFGPTLMWPAEESANMALDFMQQNLVIECLLSEYNNIFK